MRFKKIFPIFLVLILSFVVACTSTPSSSGSPSSSSNSSTPIVLIDANFDGNYGPAIYVSKGSGVAQNFLTTNVAGQTCLRIMGNSELKYGTSSVEIQWNLSSEANFSQFNFLIGFDIYVTPATLSKMAGLQFAFFNDDYDCIYSKYFPVSTADNWTRIETFIDTNSIDYDSRGINNKPAPQNWTDFTKVRIQFITSNENDPVEFYVDNLVVSNVP